MALTLSLWFCFRHAVAINIMIPGHGASAYQGTGGKDSPGEQLRGYHRCGLRLVSWVSSRRALPTINKTLVARAYSVLGNVSIGRPCCYFWSPVLLVKHVCLACLLGVDSVLLLLRFTQVRLSLPLLRCVARSKIQGSAEDPFDGKFDPHFRPSILVRQTLPGT